jgi:glycosyltransferase involved in cell wall biosynthesis
MGALFLSPQIPFWGDLFGSPLAEGQAKAVTVQDDSVLEPFARFEQVVLRRVDAVSAVSTHQEYATIGALAGCGRLNRHTDGYRLAYTIPATLDPQILPAAQSPFLRGPVVPPEAFVILWSGGFNTWTDIDTLFGGLEGAMAVRPELHFVATGGALPPHDSQTYPRFQSKVAASPYRARYHLLGWQPYEGLHNYYLESDLGLILDRWSYEGVLGSRTRLLDWLLYGLPAVVTVTAELTEELVREGLAFDFPHGDSAALAQLLVRLCGQRETLSATRERARQYVVERFAYSVACRPLVEWAKNPRRAPDAGKPLPAFSTSSNAETERLLANYRAQIEAKNAQIASLEGWANDMQARLKSHSIGLRGFLKLLRKKID